MKKHLTYILCALLMLSFGACSSDTPPEAVPSETPAAAPEPSIIPSSEPLSEPTPEDTIPASSAVEHKLVCIGDSIASGFALPMASVQRFSSLVADSLSSESERWVEFNYAVPGHTSGDMISLLNEGTASELADADIVLVCIGANNVLLPSQTFLMKYGSYSFALEAGEEPLLTADDIRAAYEDFRNAANSGAEDLRRDIAACMEYIREKNSDARVIFMTVYNPYKTNKTEIDLGGLPIPMNVMSDTFVALINDVLLSEAVDLGYEIADVYSAFEPIDDYLINGDGSPSFIADPHPNSVGHELIAETYLQIIEGA